ncbi:hypothetical protein HY213_00230 [Candidatus Peregrinibacteria bacterium]|nr:hypothetical protein [Candidatus Peregrinibacteria bacterium]
MQILDGEPRKDKTMLMSPETFVSDLRELRDRYRELANAPPIEDIVRFPDKKTCERLMGLNRIYRGRIAHLTLLNLAKLNDIQDALKETDGLHKIWNLAHSLQCTGFSIPFYRRTLKKLRELLGDEAYYAGTMPPALPLWRFQWIER